MRRAQGVNAAMVFLRKVNPLLCLLIGLKQVLDGNLSLGTFLAISSMMTYILGPIGSLIDNLQQLHLIGAHLDRIDDVFGASPEQDVRSPCKKLHISGAVSLQNVFFRYDGSPNYVLKDINLEIKKGETVAIVGSTGSGKSMLDFLLLGLYQGSQGRIRFDTIDIQDLDRSYLRSQCGILLQEPFSFSGSIRQNISLNNPAMSLNEIIPCTKLAAIHERIAAMPLGYDTMLIEGGMSLSGGERQRLSIARALALNPKILILDEATSQLDVKTEAVLHRNLMALDSTKILIAHRLSTVKNTERIFVLEEGAIVEQGCHSELLKYGGRYADLVRTQISE